MKHVNVPAGSRSGTMVGNEWLNIHVDSGVAQGGTITIPDIRVGDILLAITDLTTPAEAILSNFEITADDTVTYNGILDQSLLTLQIFWSKLVKV